MNEQKRDELLIRLDERMSYLTDPETGAVPKIESRLKEGSDLMHTTCERVDKLETDVKWIRRIGMSVQALILAALGVFKGG